MLWGRITRSVAPLRRRPVLADPADGAATTVKPKPKLSASTHGGARAAIAAPKPVPGLEPLDRRLKQRLARGTVEIDDRIDLHGRTQSEAHAALLRFLRKSQADGAKFVLVITGKGARARDGLERAWRAQAPGAAVAQAAGIPRLCHRLRGRPCRPRRGGRTLRAPAPGTRPLSAPPAFTYPRDAARCGRRGRCRFPTWHAPRRPWRAAARRGSASQCDRFPAAPPRSADRCGWRRECRAR